LKRLESAAIALRPIGARLQDRGNFGHADPGAMSLDIGATLLCLGK
jgi:hypothetical protein